VKSIIAEIAEEYINNICEVFAAGGKLGEVEGTLLREAKDCATRLAKVYVEQVDAEIVADKAGRRRAGYVVERRGDVRRLQTLVGEVAYQRTYFQKVSGGYEYLADTALGIEKRERVSGELALSLVRAAKGMSYAKASEQLTAGEVSRQTVMEKIRRSDAQMPPPDIRRQVAELHIDADEAHITLRGGKKSEVPLISVYEGIEKQGKRGICKEVLHISEYGKTPDDLWEQALTEVEARYELTDTRIYLHGDGASWIRTGLEWFPNSVFVLDKYHKNKAIKGMTAGLSLAEQKLYGTAIRDALASEDAAYLENITTGLSHLLPERAEKIQQSGGYLKTHIAGISICETDPSANHGGCTEPHVSHVLSSRLSARPMAWSKRTLTQFAPMLAGGEIRKAPTPTPSLPIPLRKAAANAKKAFCTGSLKGLGLPDPRAIGTLSLSGKVTGTQKILRFFA